MAPRPFLGWEWPVSCHGWCCQGYGCHALVGITQVQVGTKWYHRKGSVGLMEGQRKEGPRRPEMRAEYGWCQERSLGWQRTGEARPGSRPTKAHCALSCTGVLPPQLLDAGI